jgi:cytochrome c553
MRALTLLLVVIGSQAIADPSRLVEQVRAARERMHQRWDATRRMQQAIGLGDLERAHAEAKLVADLDEPEILAEWRTYIDNIQAAARQVQGTKDLVAAAKTSAQLGRECAQCHQAMKAKIVFPKELPPPSDPKLAKQMFSHAWAAARMWEGLIGPNDERWQQGARLLSNLHVDIVAESDALGIANEVARVRLFATRALKIKPQHERAELYGDMLGACARCHAAIRDR